MNKFGINLNFDSLGEAYNWPENFTDDNAFLKGLERFGKITTKFNIPITIFVIGKDLENKKNFHVLQKFCNENNVEIANHSYNHYFDFGSKNKKIIFDEIYKSHEIIFKCTNQEPRGFISPTWSISKNVISSLINLKYSYDTSLFRSVFLYPMILKIFTSHLANGDLSKSFKIINRKDYLFPFKFTKEPFFLNENLEMSQTHNKNSILEFPMPTLSNLNTPIWHTMGFFFGMNYLKKMLKKFLEKKQNFFYLMHPADFLDKSDLNFSNKHSLERLDKFNINEKIKYIEEIFEIITDKGFVGEKIKNIASDYRK